MRALCRWVLRSLMNRRLQEWNDDLGRPAVVFAPHQDDEALGCGGTIVRKRRAGADVKIVFLSDGSKSHAGLMAPAEMKALRAQEAVAAAGVLGVADKDVFFMELPDGQLSQHEETGAQKVSELLRREKPAEIFVPYYQDGPPDHHATTRIVLAALKASGLAATVYEYPVWFWHHWPWTRLESTGKELLRDGKTSLRACRSFLRDFGCCVRVSEVLDVKRAALEAHRSQVTRLVPDPSWTILGEVAGGEFLPYFFQDHEIFYRHQVTSQ